MLFIIGGMSGTTKFERVTFKVTRRLFDWMNWIGNREFMVGVGR